MRHVCAMAVRSFLASMIALLTVIAPLQAQSSRDKVTFQSVRIGFTPGPHSRNQDESNINYRQPFYKPGAWVPVYVDVLNTGKYDEKVDGPAWVVVETLDCDDALNSYRVRLPTFDMEKNPAVKTMAYTRPGSRYADFTIRIVLEKNGRELCQPHRVSNQGLDPSQVFYLALGSKLPGLKLPGQPGNVNTGQGSTSEIGLISRVEDLPPHWFGYTAADVVILATGDGSFTNGLLSDNSGRKSALAEWVRRGGKLVMLVGENRGAFNDASLSELRNLLPMDVTDKQYAVNELRLIWKDFNTNLDPVSAERPFEVTRLTPRDNRPARILMDGPKEGGGAPLIAQGAFGLGRVTLVACDVDNSPFNKWSSRGAFWEQLLKHAGPRVSDKPQTNQFNNRFNPQASEGDGVQQSLVHMLESFEGVPVISFGWVALFILLYILVVGPIDYLFLKKVVKRLELTWITFPTIVLAVSAAAYFTAYALKGNDLRINKFDLVDIDLQTKQSYGRTWFSLFSPRIQNYTIGVEPAEGWAVADETSVASTNVSWFGAPKQGQRSLFRRSYEYEPLATALHGVPIQVWSTKNFQALWQGGFAKDKPPFVAALRHPPGKPEEVIGTVTNQLPVELLDAVMIYKGQVAVLGRLAPEAPKSVSAQGRIPFSSWKNGAIPPGEAEAEARSANATTLQMNLLFHDEMTSGTDPSNGALRDVDESWRVAAENRDEVIVVAKVALASGLAEEVTKGPASACRLWLGELPTSGKPRPPLPGTLRQDTYVRVFIPVAAK